MNSASVKAVYFDAAGTLIRPSRRVGESYAAIAGKYGKRLTPDELSERFRLCFDGAPRLAFPNAASGDIHRLERDWWRTLVRRVFEPFGRFDSFEDFFTELFDYFAQPAAWTLFPEVLDTLTGLQQRGLKLAVISNFDSRLLTLLDGLGIGLFLSDVFVSSRVGYAKPDRRIFELALGRLGLQAREAIHVGDHEANDFEGARNAGLTALLIDRRATGAASADRLMSLRQILARLDT